MLKYLMITTCNGCVRMEKLKALGLNKYETEAYLTLLKMGKTTAYRLSENSEVPFGRVYEILESLENKGLVTLESKDPKKYEAVNPEIGLRALLNEKGKEWKEEKEELEDFIDSLEYKEKEVEEVKFVKSKEVYYKKLEQLVKNAKEEILSVVGGLGAAESTRAEEYERKFVEGGGSVKMMVTVTQENRQRVKRAQDIGIDLKDSPFEGIRLHVVDEEKTLIAVNKPSMIFERAALIVEDEDFSRSVKRMFNSVWEKQKEISV